MDKQNKRNTGKDTANLSAYSQALYDLLTGSGAIGDEKIEDETMRLEKQRKRQSCFHNTLLLLKNYRTLAWLLQCFPDTIAEELDTPFKNLDTIVDKLDVEMSLENRKLESRMSSIVHTRILIDRVNEALTVLKKKPGDGDMMYKVIHETYISKEHPKITDILYRLDISSRSYYRLRDEAITIISIRLWASPQSETAIWAELISTLEVLDSNKSRN